jgi:hypothetical protein
MQTIHVVDFLSPFAGSEPGHCPALSFSLFFMPGYANGLFAPFSLEGYLKSAREFEE